MESEDNTESVNIRPGVSILSVLRHLNYKPWFAMAEFVDNSLQSYLQHRNEIEWVESKDFKLRVSVEIDPADDGRITIRDNAAGIYQSEYKRAFRPAEIPPDTSGLAEFGMGMKSAACWFAPRWAVRTTALGESIERTVVFDIERIVQDDLEELVVQTKPAKPTDHYTEIILSDLYRSPQTKTIRKIKDHLASIYRVFIRDGTLELSFDNDILTYPTWPVLHKPYYKTESGPPIIWRKEIEFDFGLGLRVHGFAALFEIAHISHAGFALFRHNRLIQGSLDEGYRPEKIFGTPNKFTYQRLFGELHLEGFEVSHTKDGFRWDENEEPFLEFLEDHLNAEPLPLLDQAEGYRARAQQDALKKGAEAAAERTANVIEHEVPPVLERQITEEPDTQSPPVYLPPTTNTASKREIDVELHETKWKIILDLSNDPTISDWITVSDRSTSQDGDVKTRQVGVRLSLAHPFMERFSGTDSNDIEPLLRLAAAIGLAEIAARDSGVKEAGTIRRNINDLLRDALSKP